MVNVADFERAAAERLDPGVLGYFAGGAGDELTLRENVAAWTGWRLRPRMLAGLGEWETSAQVLGAPVSAPILVAPRVDKQWLTPADLRFEPQCMPATPTRILRKLAGR